MSPETKNYYLEHKEKAQITTKYFASHFKNSSFVNATKS